VIQVEAPEEVRNTYIEVTIAGSNRGECPCLSQPAGGQAERPPGHLPVLSGCTELKAALAALHQPAGGAAASAGEPQRRDQ